MSVDIVWAERATPAPTHAELVDDLVDRAQKDITSGRLEPSRMLNVDAFARWFRCMPSMAQEAFPLLIQAGLLIPVADAYQVAPIDVSDLLPKMDARAVLERRIARDAAIAVIRHGLTPAQRQKFLGQLDLMDRCAKVGDIEGYIRENNVLELNIAALSERAEDFATLIHMKRGFRRAWIARNWLGDLIEPVRLRTRLVHAILAGDKHQAVLAVDVFIDYLSRSFEAPLAA